MLKKICDNIKNFIAYIVFAFVFLYMISKKSSKDKEVDEAKTKVGEAEKDYQTAFQAIKANDDKMTKAVEEAKKKTTETKIKKKDRDEKAKKFFPDL